MKYCLNYNQPKEWLTKADEIYVPASAWSNIPELMVNYPDKTIIVGFGAMPEDRIDTYIKNYPNLVFKTDDFSSADDLRLRSGRAYTSYTARSFNDIINMKENGHEYVIIASPLTFSLNELKKYFPDVKFRMCPNFAWENGGKGAINATFVRPEDVSVYDETVYAFDFYSESLLQERTLYHIYAENKTWPGDIDKLITNLNTYGLSNLRFTDTFAQRRANCHQNCHICGYCNRIVTLGKLIADKDED